MPWSSKWSLSLRLPHQNSVRISRLPLTFHMPISFPSFWSPEYLVRTTYHETPSYAVSFSMVTSSPLNPHISLNTLSSQPTFLPPCDRPRFTPTQSNKQNILTFIRPHVPSHYITLYFRVQSILNRLQGVYKSFSQPEMLRHCRRKLRRWKGQLGPAVQHSFDLSDFTVF